LRLTCLLLDTATPEIYALSLHDALPISPAQRAPAAGVAGTEGADRALVADVSAEPPPVADGARLRRLDRRADARGGTTVEAARLGAATAPDRRAGRAAIGQASVRPQPGTVCPGRARLRATAPWWLSGSGAGRWMDAPAGWPTRTSHRARIDRQMPRDEAGAKTVDLSATPL